MIINPYYYPGYRSGGPQQTFMNVVEAFGDKYEFFILTLNHDMGSKEIYGNIQNGWNIVGKAKVKYVSEKEFTISLISRLSGEMNLVYAGGLFEKTTILAIIANWCNKLCCPLWIAPMGVFSDGAIKHKSIKKKAFLLTFKAFGAFKGISWSFSSINEKNEAEKYLGNSLSYVIAEDLPRQIKRNQRNCLKEANELKVIFLSRICHKKNLLKCLEILNTDWEGKIVFDIYGIKEDAAYWESCQKIIDKMNLTVKCSYCGEVESSKSAEIFSNYDVFLFPTMGENFGHVIFESLSSGCIPIISDKTIWNEIQEKNCGCVVPLDNTDKFREKINEFLKMDSYELKRISNNAIRYAEIKYKSSLEKSGYSGIFG